MIRRVFLGLGSNLGDRWFELQRAADALPDVVAVSPVYETQPQGGGGDQGPYLNCVVELVTARSARDLLVRATEIETTAGRVRAGRNGPRTLDVDILLVGDETIDEPDLVVPHPRMAERRFVLQPLADIAPEILDPRWEQRAAGRVEPVGMLRAREP